MLRGKKNAPHPPNPFSLQGEGEPEFFLVPLSFARIGARGEVFRNFHVTSVIIILNFVANC
jgi:hypothetical protein